MAVDYLARKAAKKHRKKEGLEPRRTRKKSQARRLCRGPCHSADPKLSPEDLADEKAEPGAATGSGELAKYAHMTFGEAGSSGTTGRDQQASEKRKASATAAETVVAATGTTGKRRKLSTSINLLDARTAKTEAARPKQLPAAAISAELQLLPDLLQRYMAGEGFAEVMPIQSRCWPPLLAGRDVQALAEPGSGKTLAYLLPIAALLVNNGHDAASKPEGPLALILLPTRELAQQVASTSRDLRKYSGLRTCCIHGGLDKQQQVEALTKQPHIVVATPGRLLDLLQDKALHLGDVCNVVLDESDRMLGLGFAPQIDALKQMLLPSTTAAQGGKNARRVQVGLFTATMPESLDVVASAWLHRPERISVATSEANISKSVTQVVQVCAEHKKPMKLQKHVQKIQEAAKGVRNPPRILVFVNKIKTCRFVYNLLSEAGHRVTLLHGERSQEERDASMADFRSGKAQIMVATDVAARGLHIRGLPYVCNYDVPSNLDQYIHRVGRTGRLATDGHAFTFFTRESARLAAPLAELLLQHEQQIDPLLEKLAEAFEAASEKLGQLAEITGEARSAPQKEDVLHHLGMKTQQQKKKDRQQDKRKAAKVAAGKEADCGVSDSDDEGIVGRTGGKQGGQQSVAPCSSRQCSAGDVPEFVPTLKFTGARPGYCFKKGSQGLGFYLDSVQQQQRIKRGRVAASSQELKDELRVRKRQYTHAPIGGKPQATASTVQLLPGTVKELKRQRLQAAATGQLAGFSSSDDEGHAAALNQPQPSKRLKALPGRLRKKLAKGRSA